MDGIIHLAVVIKGDDPLVDGGACLGFLSDTLKRLGRVCCVFKQLLELGIGDGVFIVAFQCVYESRWRFHHFLELSPFWITSTFEDANNTKEGFDILRRIGQRTDLYNVIY